MVEYKFVPRYIATLLLSKVPLKGLFNIKSVPMLTFLFAFPEIESIIIGSRYPVPMPMVVD